MERRTLLAIGQGGRMTTPYGEAAIDTAGDPASWELWPAPGHPEALYQRFPEFTCLCPRSGYPDFAAVHLVTVPNELVIELKHLKLWLNSFRLRRISHEAATAEILETLGELNRQGLPIILVEQKAPLALKLANRAYLLALGRIVAEIDPREVTSHDELAHHYFAA